MIFVAMILGLIGIAAFILAAIMRNNEDFMTGSVVLGIITFAISFIITIFCCFTSVPAGYVGVPTLFGQVQPQTLPSGLHFVNPFWDVQKMSTRTEVYTMSLIHDDGDKKGDDSVIALSSNGLRMPLDISMPYRLNESAAPWVYTNFGPSYVDKLLRSAARTAVGRATSRFTDQECYATKRDELAATMTQLFDQEIKGILKTYPNPPEQVVIVSEVMVRQVELPEMVRIAIERKLKADQEQQEMEFKILKEQKEAKRKEIEAGGIQKFQAIVTEGINENLLRWKAIEATLHIAESPNSKIVIIGSGKDGLPVILGNDVGK